MELGLERYRDQKTVVVTTYRRYGRPVDTPVHIGFDSGNVSMRTYESALKWKRLRRDPRIVVYHANLGRTPPLLALLAVRLVRRVGEGVPATVQALNGDEARRAAGVIGRKYPFLQGFLTPWIHRHVFHTRTLNLRVVGTGAASRLDATR